MFLCYQQKQPNRFCCMALFFSWMSAKNQTCLLTHIWLCHHYDDKKSILQHQPDTLVLIAGRCSLAGLGVEVTEDATTEKTLKRKLQFSQYSQAASITEMCWNQVAEEWVRKWTRALLLLCTRMTFHHHWQFILVGYGLHPEWIWTVVWKFEIWAAFLIWAWRLFTCMLRLCVIYLYKRSSLMYFFSVQMWSCLCHCARFPVTFCTFCTKD